MEPSRTGQGESSFKDHVLLAVKILVLILLSPLLLLLSLPYLLYGLAIIVSVWLLWHPKGKYVLFVYSNSPKWQTHIETLILPKIADLAVMLNWSERKHWQKRWTLPVLAFYYFGGRRAFNPLAVLFRPFRWPKTFRFYHCFQKAKHGKMADLHRMESNFFEALSSLPVRRSFKM